MNENPDIWEYADVGPDNEVKLSVNIKTHELLVDGVPLATKLQFNDWQIRGAVVTVISAALGGFYALLQIINWFRYYWPTQGLT